MANEKELEIKLKATGGAQAAAEVEKVEDAVKGLDKSSSATTEASDTLGKSQADLGNRFAEARAKADALKNAADNLKGSSSSGMGALFPTFAKAGQGLSALGSKMVSMAGGPIGIITAAIVGLISIWKNHDAAVNEVNGSLDETRASLDDIITGATGSSAALESATSSARDYTAELTAMDEKTDAMLDAWEESERRVLALAAAQDQLKKANIDARVAAGEITSEEGDAMKGEIDVSAVKAKADADLKLAEGRKAAADAEAARAADAEQKAAADAEAAKEALAAEKERVARAAAAIATKGIKGDIVANGSSEDAVRAMGDQESRDRLGEMDGVGGFMARTRLGMGEGPETIMGMRERAAIAKQIADEAKAEADALAESSKKSIDAAEKIAAEKEKQLEAVKSAREKADAEATKSGAAVEKAGFEKSLTLDYEVPAMEAGIATTRAQGEERAAKQAADEQARAQKEAERAAAAQQDTEAKLLAGEIQGKVASAPNAAADTGLLDALKGIASTIGNGTDSAELAGISNQLITLLSNLAAEQTASRALIANLKSRIDGMR